TGFAVRGSTNRGGRVPGYYCARVETPSILRSANETLVSGSDLIRVALASAGSSNSRSAGPSSRVGEPPAFSDCGVQYLSPDQYSAPAFRTNTDIHGRNGNVRVQVAAHPCLRN